MGEKCLYQSKSYSKKGFQTGCPGVFGEYEVIPWKFGETAGSGYMCDDSRAELASGGGRSAFILSAM